MNPWEVTNRTNAILEHFKETYARIRAVEGAHPVPHQHERALVYAIMENLIGAEPESTQPLITVAPAKDVLAEQDARIRQLETAIEDAMQELSALRKDLMVRRARQGTK